MLHFGTHRKKTSESGLYSKRRSKIYMDHKSENVKQFYGQITLWKKSNQILKKALDYNFGIDDDSWIRI